MGVGFVSILFREVFETSGFGCTRRAPVIRSKDKPAGLSTPFAILHR